MTRFEEALLAELTTRVDTELSSPPRARRRPTLVAATVGAATALAAGLLLAPGGQSPAYSLQRQADGSLRLTVDQVMGIDEANEALAAEGIRARVYRLGPPGSCPEFHLGDRPDTTSHLTNLGGTDEDGTYIPRDIPQDVTLIITVSFFGSSSHWESVGAIRGDAPPCVEQRSLPDPEPGSPTPSGHANPSGRPAGPSTK